MFYLFSFVELGNKWYVRNQGWKLNESDELFDMSNAPFKEKLIDKENQTPEAQKAYKELKAALNSLSPQNGILDTGDGTGRHGSKAKKKSEKPEE